LKSPSWEIVDAVTRARSETAEVRPSTAGVGLVTLAVESSITLKA